MPHGAKMVLKNYTPLRKSLRISAEEGGGPGSSENQRYGARAQRQQPLFPPSPGPLPQEGEAAKEKVGPVPEPGEEEKSSGHRRGE